MVKHIILRVCSIYKTTKKKKEVDNKEKVYVGGNLFCSGNHWGVAIF